MSFKNIWNPGSGSPANQFPAQERGQMMYLVAMMMLAMLGVTAMVVDVGRVFISYHELVATTDAAALAGGEAMGQPNSTSAITTKAVDDYSSMTGKSNAFGNLANVTTTPTLKCLTTLVNEGVPCYGAGAYNAVQVVQTISMPTTFMAVIGMQTVPLTATSTAAMAGAATTPYNVAIIVDSTASMADSDSGSTCNGSRLSCALGGVKTLLGELFPCSSSQSSCSVTSGVAANSVDRVALFTFPNMTTTTAPNEYDCSSTNPTINPYTFPSTTASSMSTMPYITTTTTTTGTGSNKKTTTTTTTVQMTYQVTQGIGDANGYMSDYRTSDTASTVNTSSDLSLAIGAKSGCTGMGDPGGEGTYYAGAIYAAQASLLAEQAANPGSQNVIILVSDGDATATSSQLTSTNTAGTSTTMATNSGTYPSWVNECGQAITAAKAAATAGTRVYAVAYGAESSGCTTDTSGTYKGYTPCETMQAIASSPAYFFSDYAQTGTGVDKSCAGSGASTTSINEIFTDIFTSFTVARLIPNSTT